MATRNLGEGYYGVTPKTAIDPTLIAFLLQFALQLLQSCPKSSTPDQLQKMAKSHPILTSLIIRGNWLNYHDEVTAAGCCPVTIDDNKAVAAVLHLVQNSTADDIKTALAS
jgi:hypothetical protein